MGESTEQIMTIAKRLALEKKFRAFRKRRFGTRSYTGEENQQCIKDFMLKYKVKL